MAVALAALGLASVALVAVVRLHRSLARSGRAAGGDDGELLREAWLDEIESRGQAVLARIAAAEDRLREKGWQSDPAGWEQAPVSRRPLGDAGPVRAGPAMPENPAPGSTELQGTPSPPPPEGATPTVEVAAMELAAQEATTGHRPPAAGAAALKGEVWALAAQGLDSTAIARQLGIGRGEVELILGLPKPDRG